MVRRYVVAATIAACMLHESVQGQYVWYSLGLDDRNVTCLLVDDTSFVLAGTDRGLWVRWQSEWYQVSGGIAPDAQVTALVRMASGGVIAAVGSGSNADGVYVGEMRIYGPPFYLFELLEKVQSPQSLALRGSKTDTLYVGAGNRVLMAVAGSGAGGFGPLRPLRIPFGPFGVEMPVCAALHVCTADNLLYAGGYDGSPEPGTGSLLGQQDRDSMVTLARWNVSSITEGSFREVGPVELVVGTTDSGIYRGRPGQAFNAWTRYDSPRKQSVRHMIAVPGMMFSDILYVAVDAGVYSGTGVSWTEVGDIPAVPNVLAAMGYGLPYAGTVRGVYRYGQRPLNTTRSGGVSRASGNRKTAVRAVAGVRERRGGVALLDLSGRSQANGDPAGVWIESK